MITERKWFFVVTQQIAWSYWQIVRKIPSLGESLKPLEDVIRFHFIPAITGGHLCSDNERLLLSLPLRFGGLAIPLFHKDAQYEYENSRKLTSSLAKLIKEQNQMYIVNELEINSIKGNIKTEKSETSSSKSLAFVVRPSETSFI